MDESFHVSDFEMFLAHKQSRVPPGLLLAFSSIGAGSRDGPGQDVCFGSWFLNMTQAQDLRRHDHWSCSSSFASNHCSHGGGNIIEEVPLTVLDSLLCIMPRRKKKSQPNSAPLASASSDVHVATSTGGIPIYDPPASRFVKTRSGRSPKAVFAENFLNDDDIRAQVWHDMEQVPLSECCDPRFSHCEKHKAFEPTCHRCRVQEYESCFRAYHLQNVLPIQYMLLEQYKYQTRFMQELVSKLSEKELLNEWQPALDGQRLQKHIESIDKRITKLEEMSLKQSILDAQRKALSRPPVFVKGKSHSRGSSRASSVSSRASHMSDREIKVAAEKHLDEAKQRREEQSLHQS